MELLLAVPVMLLIVVAVWLLWPLVADQVSRAMARRGPQTDADRVADSLFATWAEHGDATGLIVRP